MSIKQTWLNIDLNAVIFDAFRNGATMEDVLNGIEDAKSDAPATQRAASAHPRAAEEEREGTA